MVYKLKNEVYAIRENLVNMFKARFPVLYIITWEEERATNLINEISNDESIIKTKRNVYIWNQVDGIVVDNCYAKEDTKQPIKVLEFIEKCDEPAIFVLKDLHVYLNTSSKLYDYNIIRKIRNIIAKIKSGIAPQNIVLISPIMVLPNELQKDITILEFELPNIDEIRTSLDEIIVANEGGRIIINLDDNERDKLCKAALGLTLQEAENAFAKAMVKDGTLDINDLDVILDEKCQIIKKTGILEFFKTDLKIEDVGGLENLKKWLLKRSRSWSSDATKYNLPSPKGVLITGVPGCGKSLIAKSISAMWKMPLLRLDMGSIFSSLLGSSEENMRKAIKMSEAIAPSILWIDEIEKGFSGVNSSSDSGVATRIFGTFLTWMQEKTSPVFVIATANNISSLPSEFLRKGRFDEIFFVDLPTKKERKDIFKVHFNKNINNPEIMKSINIDDKLFENLAEITEGFVGAEIEQIVISALFEAFHENRGLIKEDFIKVIKNTIPLSVTQAEQIIRIREWANIRAVAATAREDRNEYSDKNTNDSEVAKYKDEMKQSRGGRTVEF